MRGAIDLDAMRARLEAMKAEIEALESGSADARAAVELDQTRQGRLSRMDALQSQAMAKATAERRAQALRRIDAALRQIESGEFGYCVVCDEPIAPRRLENDPSVPTCIACAERAAG